MHTSTLLTQGCPDRWSVYSSVWSVVLIFSTDVFDPVRGTDLHYQIFWSGLDIKISTKMD